MLRLLIYKLHEHFDRRTIVHCQKMISNFKNKTMLYIMFMLKCVCTIVVLTIKNI